MAGAQRTYLDHNATSALRPEARAAMVAALDAVGNASSVHAEGRAARALVEAAREGVAALVGAKPANVVFTAGGSEAAALALTPRIEMGGTVRTFDRLLVSVTEHACILAGGRFAAHSIEILPVDPRGVVDAAGVAARLADLAARGLRAVVAVQAANNETGVVQDLAAIAAAVHAHQGILVCDAVQAPGRIGFDLKASGADFAILSAHKLGGPQGVGALVAATGSVRVADPLVRGGGQERGMRAGTENVPAIAGFGAAARAVRGEGAEAHGRLATLRDAFETGLRQRRSDAVIFGAGAGRLPNTSLYAIPGRAAEVELMRLDLAGIALSSGSACSSGKVRASHVLAAMGIEADLARCALRLSLGWTSTIEDVNRCLGAYENRDDTLSERPGRAAA
ncbi:cysteine desulfurase family protein [uncultured Alsobacter sp.]|uniref:cysteine desulfurase family protein n=1 Tax=uncultured Alsobacter sp. TaxID=1748258 RepID=UPI0025EB76AC|nr:cysteine desulfurase family protein [uncultured Alsobacter sp.]